MGSPFTSRHVLMLTRSLLFVFCIQCIFVLTEIRFPILYCHSNLIVLWPHETLSLGNASSTQLLGCEVLALQTKEAEEPKLYLWWLKVNLLFGEQ